MVKLSFRSVTALLSAAVVPALSSCVTRQQDTDVPRPRNGIAEYQQLVGESQHAVQRAQDALDHLSHAPSTCSPGMLVKFSKEVHRLEIESIRIRARAKAIQDRGDAYFENWRENLTQVKESQVRELVDQHRIQLQQHFVSVKRLSNETRDSFRLFLSGLRGVRNALEKDLSALQADAMRDSTRATKEHGKHVEESLATISQELQAMHSILTPTSPAAAGH
jgi:hypothetical protein